MLGELTIEDKRRILCSWINDLDDDALDQLINDFINDIQYD